MFRDPPPFRALPLHPYSHSCTNAPNCVEIPLSHSRTSVYPQGNLLCVLFTPVKYSCINSPVLSCLFLSSLNDRQTSDCRPTLLPAAMASLCAFSSRSFPPPGSPLPISYLNLGRLGVGAPGENLLLSSVLLRTKRATWSKSNQHGKSLRRVE